MVTMVTRPPPRTGPARRPATVLLPVKMVPDQRKRFRMLCMEYDKTYAEMIIMWMDERESLIKRSQAQQAHPMHRPQTVAPVSTYPGARA